MLALACALLAVAALAVACGAQGHVISVTPSPGAQSGKPTGPGTPVSGVPQTSYVPTDGYTESLLTANGVTYVGSSTGAVYALNASGAPLWRADLGAAGLYGADATAVYALSGDGQATVSALSAATGATLWRRTLAPDVLDAVLAGDTLYVAVNEHDGAPSEIVALRTSDGSVRWQFSASGSLAQAHLTVDAGVVYAQLYAEPAEAYTLVALAAGDGHRLWSYPGGQDPAAFTAAGSTVYVAWSPSQPGTTAPCGSEWDALAGASGAVVWHVTRPGDDQPRQLLLKGGVLYSAGQSLSALRASDGAVLWQAATAISPGGNAEPVVGDGALYYAADLGTIHALSLSDGHELWQRHVDNSALMLALAPGRLVVATQSKLVYALRAADGSLAWQQPADTFNSILGPAFGFVVAGGVAYVGTDHGVVQALRADDGAVLWRFAVAPKPALTEPVYSAYVQFRAGTTYAQALRAVTDLGLRVSGHPCVSPGTWQPVNWSDTWQDSAGAFLVAATPISRPDWLDALKQSAGAADAQADPVFHCPALGFDPNAIPGLPQGQEGTPVRVTFATGTSYDAALAAVTRLGFRLANPCYERQPQGAPVEWSPVGQEAVFASTGALLVATTPSNAATWQQIRQAGGVASVAVSPPLTCP